MRARSSTCRVPGSPPSSIASISNSLPAASMMGSRFMPQVPPSTSSTPAGAPAARSRSSAAMPTPSSAMIGLPSPMTTVPPPPPSLIDIVLVTGHEAATRDDRGDRAGPLDVVGPDREVEVDRQEDQEQPGEHVVHEVHLLDAAQHVRDPAERLIEEAARVRLAVHREPREHLNGRHPVQGGVAQLLQRVVPQIMRRLLGLNHQVELHHLPQVHPVA